MAVIEFNTGGAVSSADLMKSITDRYELEHNDLDDSIRMKNFENEIAENIANRLQEENKKAIRAGETVSNTVSVNTFEQDEMTKFYKDELGSMIKDVGNMTRHQIKTQQTKMKVMFDTMAKTDVIEREFLEQQFKKSQEFLSDEYKRKSDTWKMTKDLFHEATQSFLNFESVGMALVGNNPLGAMAVQMGARVLKRRTEQKKQTQLEVEQQLHRHVMVEKNEEDKAKFIKDEKTRKEELDKLSEEMLRDQQAEQSLQPVRAESGYDSLMARTDGTDDIEESGTITPSDETTQSLSNTSTTPLFVKVVGGLPQQEIQKSLPMAEGSVAEQVQNTVKERKDRKTQMKHYQKTEKWQKSMLKCVCGGQMGMLPKGKGKGKFGLGSGGKGGGKLGMLGTIKDLAMTAGGLGIGGAGITSMFGDKLASAKQAGGSMLKTVGSGASKLVKGIPAIAGLVEGGMEYSEGGSVGSSIAKGGGAVAGGLAGASTGAMMGAVLGPVGMAVGGALGGIIGSIGGSELSGYLFGDSDQEKQANLKSKEIEDSGIIDRNDLLPFEDSKILKPEKLKSLSVSQLQSLIDIDDFSEDDTQLIQDAINSKKNNSKSITKDVSKPKEKKVDRNNQESLTGKKPMESKSDRQAIDGMLDKIGKAESNNDYDAEWGSGKYGTREKDLTSMTMGEVKEYQREMIRVQKNEGKSAGQRSSALGKYQFISSSMKEAQSMSGLSDDDLYSEENQDKMGEMWLRKRGGLDKFMKSGRKDRDADKMQNKVASQWASMKNIRGYGNYDTDGMNTARHSVRDEIDQLVNNAQPFPDVALNDVNKNNLTASNAGTTSVEKLIADQTTNTETVTRIQNTSDEIEKGKEEKQNTPVVVNQVANNTSSDSGGGTYSGGTVTSARNNNTSLQRITDRYISSGMS